jgi:glycosyltransferase involved in cell wall biosynthesis
MTQDTNSDRPLVTFAVFAYNQEQYIREAIQGAFSQTYEPLEIILSDDCSSDKTFAIMQEMAAAYEGPNEVRVRQSEVNAGVLNHILSTVRQAAGKIMIVSAGDDISFPQRSEILSDAFTNNEIYAVSSDDVIIDEFGNEKKWDLGRFERRDYWYDKDPTWIHGATAAYRVDFLKELPLSDANVFYEDMVFSDILRAINKRSIRLPIPLISYRYHFNNLSNRMSADTSPHSNELKSIERGQRVHGAKNYCLFALSALAASGNRISASCVKKLRGEERYFFYIMNWMDNGLIANLKMLYYASRFGNLKSSFVRMLGPSTFYMFKRLKGLRNET